LICSFFHYFHRFTGLTYLRRGSPGEGGSNFRHFKLK